MAVRILVVDNYDSFVFNLVQYLGQLGAEVDVRRNDEVTPDEARGYDGVLLSPGPGTPAGAGVCLAVVRELSGVLPVAGEEERDAALFEAALDDGGLGA